MTEGSRTAVTRRAVLGDLARGIGAVAAVGGLYALAARRGGRCHVPTLCAACAALKACTLPAAQGFRAGRAR